MYTNADIFKLRHSYVILDYFDTAATQVERKSVYIWIGRGGEMQDRPSWHHSVGDNVPSAYASTIAITILWL
jgi:hypothetical protein